ncbi:MAG: hypothetical protein AAFU59_01460 [Pseudomonadota bacterium]
MTETVLAKKLSNRRVGRSPIPQLPEIAADFAGKVEECLRKFLKTTTGAMVMSSEVRKLARVLEDIPVPAMLGVIEVDGVDNFALLNINSDLVYHIVDLRMGGDPANAPPPTARSFTSIDCSLCEGFVEKVLGSFTDAVEVALGAPVRHGLRLSHIEQNVTQVRLAPSNADVLVITLNLDIGEAARMGDCELVIPLSVLDTFRAEAASAPTPTDAQSSQDFWRQHMTEAASNAQAPVTAVVHTAHLTLEDLDALEPDAIIPIPENAIRSIRLMIGEGHRRSQFAVAKLGAFEGRKVVKLNGDMSGEVREHLVRSITSRT